MNALGSLRQALRAWLFRPKIESGMIVLNQRRIFILPTRQGLGFAVVLVIMLLSDINYSLSLGFVLTFLLGSISLMAMLHTFRNLARLEITPGRIDPVFAGDMAQFTFHFRNNGKLHRHRLTLRNDEGRSVTFDIAPLQGAEVRLPIPAEKRGWQSSGRLTLYSEFPLGLFHAWSYLQFDTRCLVYPRPARHYPLPAVSGQNTAGKPSHAGDDDFAGLRNYVAGDALPRIAWKAMAREQGLQVKQFSAQQGEELWLDWSCLPQLQNELKLEILTRWVLDADAQGLHYGLRLPGIELSPELGSRHRAECLRALALYNLPDKRTEED